MMRVFVKFLAFPGYKLLAIRTDPPWTVEDVKTHIFNARKIPKEIQRLTFRGTILQNERTLASYSIIRNVTFYMSLRFMDEMQIYIKCLNGNTITIETDASATAQSLISSALTYDKNPRSLRPQGASLFLLGGKRLCDGTKISEYEEIRDGSTLYLDHSCDFSVNSTNDNSSIDFSPDPLIYIKYMKSRIITFDYNIEDTILEIKSKIQVKEGIPTFLQCLSFKGTRLECDESLLISYSIIPGSTLLLELEAKTIPIQCEIWLEDVKTEETLRLQVGLNDKIMDLKFRIQELKGFAPANQRVFFNKELLNEDNTFISYNVGPQSSLQLYLDRRGEIPLLIQTMGGIIYPLEVNPFETIAEMLGRMCYMEETPVSKQCLYFEDQMLEGNRMLSYYNIEKGSTLHLLNRLL